MLNLTLASFSKPLKIWMTNIIQLFHFLVLPLCDKASPLRHENPAFHQMLQNTTKIENFPKLFYLDLWLFWRFLILLLQFLWVSLVPEIDSTDGFFSPCFLPRCWFILVQVLFPMLYQNVHFTCTPHSTSFFSFFFFSPVFFANISSIILSISHCFASYKIPRCNILMYMRYMCDTTVCLVESTFFKRWLSYKFMTCMKVLQKCLVLSA